MSGNKFDNGQDGDTFTSEQDADREKTRVAAGLEKEFGGIKGLHCERLGRTAKVEMESASIKRDELGTL